MHVLVSIVAIEELVCLLHNAPLLSKVTLLQKKSIQLGYSWNALDSCLNSKYRYPKFACMQNYSSCFLDIYTNNYGIVMSPSGNMKRYFIEKNSKPTTMGICMIFAIASIGPKGLIVGPKKSPWGILHCCCCFTWIFLCLS